MKDDILDEAIFKDPGKSFAECLKEAIRNAEDSFDSCCIGTDSTDSTDSTDDIKDLRSRIINHLAINTTCSICPLSVKCPQKSAQMNWNTLCKNIWEENLLACFGGNI